MILLAEQGMFDGVKHLVNRTAADEGRATYCDAGSPPMMRITSASCALIGMLRR